MANCSIEQWIGTLRHELLDRTIIRSEQQLRRLIVDYLGHYNQVRLSHGVRDQQPPF